MRISNTSAKRSGGEGSGDRLSVVSFRNVTSSPCRLPSRETAILFGLLALTCAVRLPFAENIGADEAFFAVIGRDWAAGAVPYVERFDVKPPGLFLLYALIEPVFGVGVSAIKGLEVGFVAASAYGLWRIGRDFFSGPVGAAAAALYPFYSLAMSGVNAPTALFLAAFEIFAVLAALNSRAALSGVLFGCAFVMKQTAAIEAAALLVAYLIPLRRRLRPALAFIAGSGLAPMGFALHFWLEGAFPALWSAVVVAGGGRLAGDNVGFLEGLTRLPALLRPLLIPSIGALLVILRARQWDDKSFAPALRLLLGWTTGGLLAVIAMRGMYDHYVLPLTGPLLLIAAVAVFHVADLGPPGAARLKLGAFALAAVLWPVLFGFAPVTRAGEGEDRSALLAAEKVLEPRDCKRATRSWRSIAASWSMRTPGPSLPAACFIRSICFAIFRRFPAISWRGPWQRARVMFCWRTLESAWCAKRKSASTPCRKRSTRTTDWRGRAGAGGIATRSIP